MNKADKFYNSICTLTLIADCTEISSGKWEQYMKGSTKANYQKIHVLIHKKFPEYNWITKNNPYQTYYRKTSNMLILVHSAIEYFFKIN